MQQLGDRYWATERMTVATEMRNAYRYDIVHQNVSKQNTGVYRHTITSVGTIISSLRNIVKTRIRCIHNTLE